MEILEFVFSLGVLFVIFGFIWGLIELGFSLLSAGRQRHLIEIYTLKALKYIFLVDVTFIFSIQHVESMSLITNRFIMAGLLLLTYFIGKLQNTQNQQMLFKMVTVANGLPKMKNRFNMRAELFVIFLSLGLYATFWFYPELATNPISNWFHESIVNIEDTPIFGFIFRVIGFFFILSLIFKMSAALGFILSGQAFREMKSNDHKQKNSDGFDDFTEVD